MAVAEQAPPEAAFNPGVQALELISMQESGRRRSKLARQQIIDPSCSNVIKAEMHHIEAASFYQMGRLHEAEKSNSSGSFY